MFKSFLSILLLFLVVAPLPSLSFAPKSRNFHKELTKMGAGKNIEVVSQPDKNFLEKKGCLSWGTWGCEASKFPWTYDSNESCYLLKGKVTVIPDNQEKYGPPVSFGAGDFVTFPAGMSCTWDVSEAVHKHFMFF